MAKIDEFFRMMAEQGASDLHMISGQQPVLRVDGELERIAGQAVLTQDTLHPLLDEIMPGSKKDQFESTGDVDFGYEIPGLARFRCNCFNHKYGLGAVFRKIPSKILTAEELGLPPILTRAAMLKKGLVLVTGPTGSGKSTTLAAMVDHANKHRKDHILTVEDPIEFVHQSQGCIVNHREVGLHTMTFASALRGALREDPDIILVGEMRDLETISLAIEAAATGHLVFGTLHTENAAKTVDRIVEVFPHGEQPQIRNTLSTALRVVVAQNLFKRIDRKGRCAALEILICTSAVGNLIRDAKTVQIPSAMQTGKAVGMQTLDDAIQELLSWKWISPEEAYEKSIDKTRFAKLLKTPPDALQ
ncbi:MAG: type IV pilus twitching motility protein PilT [Nitrospira sp. CG24C]|jgi:twitching motility protein PilT|nr:MAG: type IV pilus twitching motility protein PilT [Nitrospira sp. CG24C]TKB53552.1 MAG: type IV pilus twitching motility protein PilT [Nitrospira sp.]